MQLRSIRGGFLRTGWGSGGVVVVVLLLVTDVGKVISSVQCLFGVVFACVESGHRHLYRRPENLVTVGDPTSNYAANRFKFKNMVVAPMTSVL